MTTYSSWYFWASCGTDRRTGGQTGAHSRRQASKPAAWRMPQAGVRAQLHSPNHTAPARLTPQPHQGEREVEQCKATDQGRQAGEGQAQQHDDGVVGHVGAKHEGLLRPQPVLGALSAGQLVKHEEQDEWDQPQQAHADRQSLHSTAQGTRENGGGSQIRPHLCCRGEGGYRANIGDFDCTSSI